MSLPETSRALALGEFSLEPATRTLRRGKEAVPLTKRPFQVLVYLVEHADRVVTREELFDEFWDGQNVYDEALSKCIGAIRKALGDSAESPRFIATHYGEGYRYIGPLGAVESAGDDVSPPMPTLEVERTSGVRIVVEDVRPETVTATAAAEYPELLLSRRAFAIAAITVLLVVAGVGFALSRRSAPAAPPPRPQIDSVAVLPLANLSANPDDEYLGDGITEGLITELSRVNGLRVIARGSAFAFKGTDADPVEAGRRLGVSAVVTGSVASDGRTTRVQLRLVSTEDGRVLWSGDSFDRPLAELIEVQDAAVCQLVSELRARVCGEGERVARRYTDNAAAYRAYLKGRYHWNRRYANDMQRAIEAYARAIEADPSYALAHAALAETWAVMECNAQVPPGSGVAPAREHAERAIALDDSLPGAYAALGLLAGARWDRPEAERHFRQALELSPGYVPARQWLANVYTVEGRFAEAEATLLAAREIDPLSIPLGMSLAELYGYMRDYEKLTAHAEALRAADPSSTYPDQLMVRVYRETGRYDEALALLDRAGQSPCENSRLLYLMGRVAEARACVEAAAKSETALRAPYSMACRYATLGDADEAFRWLERALQARQPDLVSLNVDPAMDGLRSDPRFARYQRAVGFAGES